MGLLRVDEVGPLKVEGQLTRGFRLETYIFHVFVLIFSNTLSANFSNCDRGCNLS